MNLGAVLIVLAAVALSVDAGGCPHSGAQVTFSAISSRFCNEMWKTFALLHVTGIGDEDHGRYLPHVEKVSRQRGPAIVAAAGVERSRQRRQSGSQSGPGLPESASGIAETVPVAGRRRAGRARQPPGVRGQIGRLHGRLETLLLLQPLRQEQRLPVHDPHQGTLHHCPAAGNSNRSKFQTIMTVKCDDIFWRLA